MQTKEKRSKKSLSGERKASRRSASSRSVSSRKIPSRNVASKRKVAAKTLAAQRPARPAIRKSLKRNVVPKAPKTSDLLKGAIKIYDDCLAIEAVKGKDSLWPKEKFRHDFKSSRGKAAVYGLSDGSILIKGKKRLWENLNF